MLWLKGAGTVAPEDADGFPEERRGLSGWIKRHPVAASVGITLAILGIIAAIVVPVTCSIHGCPPKKEETSLSDLYNGAPKRLVVAFLNDVDVADLIPPILQPYASRVQMLLSNLQILEATSDSVLNVIISEIEKRTDVEFFVRDFVLRAPSIVEGATDSSSTSRRSLQQTTTQQNGFTLNDPGLSSAWWFNTLNVTGAWKLLNVNATAPSTQTSDVVIAVTDSGAAVWHPDLLTAWWNNPGEVDGDMADNDNNTFIDDFYGACFSTVACSPTYPGNNASRCGIGRNTSAWNGITDVITHGTKIAGIIGATPNNGLGGAGVAPNLRQMILKVTDESYDPSNPPYAYSDVVRAVDYAYGKGARIFSMSFGPNARQSKTDFNKPGLDNAAAAYKTLFTKYNKALFVAAAGNEWTNLDTWRTSNYTYPPCMVDTPNTLCVGATNSSDAVFYMWQSNQDVGTNWGPTTVDLGAPGLNIYTTDFNGTFSSPSGTSFSTPMVAAVAGLVLSAMGGQARATNNTPVVIKNILMTSGDPLSSLQGKFKSIRRLNAGNAVAAGLTYAATNRTVMKPARNLSDVVTSVAIQGWEYHWWFKATYTDVIMDPFGLYYLDYQIRNLPTSSLSVFRYATGTLLMATAMVRIDKAGQYSLQVVSSTLTPDRWLVTLGETPLIWNMFSSTQGTVDLVFPTPGYYNMTVWMNPDGNPINFQWLLPGSPSWSNPAIFWVLHEDPPSARYYDPNATSVTKPALWHVVWNEQESFDVFSPNGDRGYFVRNKDPRLYRQQQALLTDFSFATGSDLKNALYGTGNGPSGNNTVVYGYARANLRALTYGTTIGFRLQGPNTRLYVNDQNVFDFQSDTTLQIVSPCVALRSNTAHEIYFYFAAKVTSSNPVGITWTPCSSATATTAPGGNTGVYTSMTSSLATNFFWANSNPTGLPRGFRCDAWPGNGSVTQIGTTPAFGTPGYLTWMYPRDCPASYKTSAGECRMQTRLTDLFPNVTWNNWSVRCWTYWAGSLLQGTSGAWVLSGPIFQHLAGVRVFDQFGNGMSNTNYAPQATRFPTSVYQLYVVEWVALGTQWNLLASQTILNGVSTSNSVSDMLTTDSNNMILPTSAVVNMTWKDTTWAQLTG